MLAMLLPAVNSLQTQPLRLLLQDCEMTGLFLEEQRGSYLDDMEDRYREVCTACSARRAAPCSCGAQAGWQAGMRSLASAVTEPAFHFMHR